MGRAGNARPSLRRQLLAVLVALSLPLLVVAPVGGLLLRSTSAEHASSSSHVRVAADLSDLQARVAALTSSLTERRLIESDLSALLQFVQGTRAVEAGFEKVRARVSGADRAALDEAYDRWRGLADTLAALPPRFPAMLVDASALSAALSDLGPRLLALAQTINATAAVNAQALQADLDRAHEQQRWWVLQLLGAALCGLAASFVAARWLYRRIMHPLVALQLAARRFGEDELQEPVVVDRTPELGALGTAFNQMAGRLQESRALLLAREQRFRSLVQHSSDLVALLDVSAVVTYATPSVRQVLGVGVEDVVGTRLLDRVHPDDRQLVAAVVEAALTGSGEPGVVGARLRRSGPDGDEWRHAELLLNDLTADPAVRGLVLTARDVTEQTRLHEQLRHRALHDELTGLANRVLFGDRVAHALTGRDRTPPAVLSCDLDDFRTVNDTLGHGAGDALLVAVAERVGGSLRARDTAARFGGDEFAVLLEDVSAEEAREAAERLQAAVGQLLVLEGVELVPRMSIGIATGTTATGADELLRQADAALRQAKHQGKNDVVVYDPDLAEDLLVRLELTSDLQRALRDGEFVLHYQPLVDLRTGRVTGVEALVRWDHPRRGRVSPADFVPLAEQTGLIVKLGLWVLEEACGQLQAWLREHPDRDLHVSVNLSGRQLEDPEVVDDVASVLALTGLDPARLTLELTETVLLDRSEQVLARLHGLRRLGLRLAIDDFGTGYSSLDYLQRLPVDVLKIDKSFVDGLGDLAAAGSGEALAATIVQLARTLGLSTVGEGIEQAAQADALRHLGCETGQGYLFSRPLPAAELGALLAASASTPPLG